MKNSQFSRLFAPLMVAALIVTIIIGCKTTQQGVVLNTLSSLEQSTTAAYDGYLALVVQGKIPTNGVPKISGMYNTFQADMVIAVVAVQGNSNAVAPQSLISESATLLSTIPTTK